MLQGNNHSPFTTARFDDIRNYPPTQPKHIPACPYNARKLTFAKNLPMAFDVTGKLVAKFETVQRTATFKTREFVIETNEDINGRTITNYVKFQSVQDRTSIIDRFNIGDMVKVHFNLKGSRWEKNGQVNYITNLDAWRIENAGMSASAPSALNEPAPFSAPVGDSAPDDLPF
jgi:hypothetical protein